MPTIRPHARRLLCSGHIPRQKARIGETYDIFSDPKKVRSLAPWRHALHAVGCPGGARLLPCVSIRSPHCAVARHCN